MKQSQGSHDRMRTIAALAPFLATAVGLLIAGAGYFFLVLPQLQLVVPGGEYDIAPATERLAEGRAYATQLDGVLQRFNAMNGEDRQKINNMVPEEADLPGIFVTLDAIAKAHNFLASSVSAVTTLDAQKTGKDKKKTLQISTEFSGGTFDQFKGLLVDLGRSERILDVESIVFSANKSDYAVMMKAYYISPETPAAQPVAAEQ